jgi:hypothetical protein
VTLQERYSRPSPNTRSWTQSSRGRSAEHARRIGRPPSGPRDSGSLSTPQGGQRSTIFKILFSGAAFPIGARKGCAEGAREVCGSSRTVSPGGEDGRRPPGQACFCAGGAGGGCGGVVPPTVNRRVGRRPKAVEQVKGNPSDRSSEPVGQVKRTPGPVRTGEFAGPGAAAPGRPGKPAGRGPGGWSGNSPPGDLSQGRASPAKSVVVSANLVTVLQVTEEYPTLWLKCLSSA